LGTGRAIRAALAPFGTLVLRSSSRTVGADAAFVALYVNVPPAASPLALGVSLATWLPGGASAPVASLCIVSQSAAGAALVAQPSGGAAGADACTAGAPDAAGWTRVAVALDAFAAAGWDELQLSDVTGRGAVVALDDAVLLRAVDVAARGGWDANAPYCAQRMDGILYGCTVPPSAECCAEYAAFNAQGCYCIAAFANDPSMQRARPRRTCWQRARCVTPRG
jgi:hypothetical protein